MLDILSAFIYYVCGYPTVPKDIRLFVFLKVKYLYANILPSLN